MFRFTQKIVTIVALLTATILGVGVGYGLQEDAVFNPKKIALPDTQGSQIALPNFPAPPKVPKYLLKEYEGKVAVFMGNKTQPEMIFDTYVHLLPDIDRKELKQGIEVENYAQLLVLIEDYTS